MIVKEQKRFLRAIVETEEEFDVVFELLSEEDDEKTIVDKLISYRNKDLKKKIKRKPQNVALGLFVSAMVVFLITIMIHNVWLYI